MSMCTKSIQLLLCFVFSLWSIAGPVSQTPCFAAPSDTLAPQFKKKTIEEMEQVARAMREKKTQLLLPQLKTPAEEIIAERLLPPAIIRKTGQLHDLKEKLRSIFSAEELKNIAPAMPDVWDGSDRIINLRDQALRNFVLAAVRAAAAEQAKTFSLIDDLSVEELQIHFQSDNGVDLTIATAAQKKELGYQDTYNWLLLFAAGNQDRYNLREAADILRRSGLVSAGVWKLILEADRIEGDPARDQNEKKNAQLLRRGLYLFMQRCGEHMKATGNYRDIVSNEAVVTSLGQIASSTLMRCAVINGGREAAVGPL